MPTRREVLLGSLFLILPAGLRGLAAPKASPFEVTYYYLPG